MTVERPEFERAIDQLGRQLELNKSEIILAVGDLKRSIDGQGDKLSEHDRKIAVLEDRADRDVVARWGAGIGVVIATVAAYLGFK